MSAVGESVPGRSGKGSKWLSMAGCLLTSSSSMNARTATHSPLSTRTDAPPAEPGASTKTVPLSRALSLVSDHWRLVVPFPTRQLMPTADTSLPLLSKIDPYGDIELGAVIHVSAERRDRQAAPLARPGPEHRGLLRLRALAEACAGNPGTTIIEYEMDAWDSGDWRYPEIVRQKFEPTWLHARSEGKDGCTCGADSPCRADRRA